MRIEFMYIPSGEIILALNTDDDTPLYLPDRNGPIRIDGKLYKTLALMPNYSLVGFEKLTIAIEDAPV